ncbi:hypothetical protein F4821DRAFT_132754 [Hypoxylon rubiginosum]|uniref:Uncharacterized protein n=1 Tax=Hypoxylon rubiginosum TaxID=110542 RepID=A0ACC0D0X3_9PEZI|nr:hypothetical protein F4821DRAFT_132754 [Hypoxylon rubiginosum]
MFTKTTAIFGLVAASGVMAGEYPAYKADNATSMAMPTAKGTAAPTPVWQYYNMTVPTTVVVPQFTTVCPEAATLTYNEVPYTVTKGQTLTVTDCPCTVTKPVVKMTSSLCAPGVTPTGTAMVPAMPGATYPSMPGSNNPAPNSPAAPGYPAPPVSAPAVPAAPGYTQSMTAAASASAMYTASPSGVQVAGAPASSTSQSGFAVALFAAFMGALAL